MGFRMKVWTEQEIKHLIESNDTMVIRSVKTLYQYQTQDEQIAEHTKVKNHVGFNAFDAEFLTSIAKQILNGGNLSTNKIRICRKKLTKYTKQLTKIANKEI